MPAYAELQVTTNFSFLRGASHPGELVEAAKKRGLAAIAVTDWSSLAGVVRAHMAAKEHGIRLVVGCRLVIDQGPASDEHGEELKGGTQGPTSDEWSEELKGGIRTRPAGERANAKLKGGTETPPLHILCYPRDRAAYGRLCRLLTRGKRAAPKGECFISLDDVIEFGEGQNFVVVPPEEPDAAFRDAVSRIMSAFPGRVRLAMAFLYRGDEAKRLARLAAFGRELGLPLVAVNDVHYHVPERRPLQDVVTCIREKCLVANAGFRLAANAERHLKDASEMARLFRHYPEAIAETVRLAEDCNFNLDELGYEYPDEPVPPGKTPQEHLEDLTWKGAAERYPEGVPDSVRAVLQKELALVAKLDYAPYFLTVHDIVHYARSIKILCQGRGSAANSAVCYCIGITAVNPAEVSLLFERFLSEARKEPPDIDVDFEHERREEVIQYIYARYGRHRASLTATVISYRPRSAVREVGKVMGLSEDVTSALARTVWGSWGSGVDEVKIREAGLDPNDKNLMRVIELTGELIGFPRHLSQHVGGFVLTRDALEETVPIGNAAMDDRTFIEWDKDDIDALGILKVDVLGLGMLTCIRKCFELIEEHYGETWTLPTIPREDKAVYRMLQKADAIGVFQVESRAQLNMLPRLKPEKFYDLVIEVAIVRPGPIQGDMVHPYLRRRDGIEKADLPSPAPEHGPPDELQRVLGRTLGVPLFQEQAMQIAIDAAKFTPDEANNLRRAMATFRRMGTIGTLEDKFVSRLIARGYEADFAHRCFDQIKGFGEYGFPESHAASFALLVYVSAWLKCHYPAAFCAALLNSQPMGFYAPAQIVRDAREHDVEVQPVDAGHSAWDNMLEPAGNSRAVRLGFRQVDGMSEAVAERIVAARQVRPLVEPRDLAERARVPVAIIEKLAAADAFRSLGLDRRQALWAIRGLRDAPPLPLFDHAATAGEGPDVPVALPEMPLSEHVVADYQTLRLSLKAHPMSFLREHYAALGVASAADVRELRNGARVKTAGVVLIRQRPGSAKGVVFITIEDETGISNAVVWPKVLLRYRKVVMGARLMLISGRIQRAGDIIHVVAGGLEDLSGDLALLSEGDMPVPVTRADEIAHPTRDPVIAARTHPRNVRIIPKSRDFH